MKTHFKSQMTLSTVFTEYLEIFRSQHKRLPDLNRNNFNLKYNFEKYVRYIELIVEDTFTSLRDCKHQTSRVRSNNVFVLYTVYHRTGDHHSSTRTGLAAYCRERSTSGPRHHVLLSKKSIRTRLTSWFPLPGVYIIKKTVRFYNKIFYKYIFIIIKIIYQI